jgi:hypothetical protein
MSPSTGLVGADPCGILNEEMPVVPAAHTALDVADGATPKPMMPVCIEATDDALHGIERMVVCAPPRSNVSSVNAATL